MRRVGEGLRRRANRDCHPETESRGWSVSHGEGMFAVGFLVP